MSRSDTAAIEAAVAAASAVAAGFGVGRGPAEVLHAGANVVVRLSPEPVVARVAHWTALTRPDPAAVLAREVEQAGWLAGRGVAVVAPSGVLSSGSSPVRSSPVGALPVAALPAGPHRSDDGHVLTFWTAVAGAAPDPDPAATATALAGVHTALADYAGDLPDGPRQIVADSLASIDAAAGAGLLDDDRARRLAAGAELADELPPSGQALHGDPHPGNLVATAAGDILWTDFEDAFRGPVEWDLVILRGTVGDTDVAQAAYTAATGVRPDPGLLAACRRLREWQAVCWVLLSAVHHTDRAEMADELVTRWLADEVEHVFD